MSVRDSHALTVQSVGDWAVRRGDEVQGLLLVSASALAVSGLGRPEGELGRVALAFREVLGTASFYPPLVLGLWGVRRMAARPAYASRGEVLAWGALLPQLTAILHQVHPMAGGRTGFWIWAYLEVLAGPRGAWIVLASAGFLTVGACLELSPSQLVTQARALSFRVVVWPAVGLIRGVVYVLSGMQHLVYLVLRDVWIIINLLSERLQRELEAEGAAGSGVAASRTDHRGPPSSPATRAPAWPQSDPAAAPAPPAVRRRPALSLPVATPLRINRVREDELFASPRMARAAAVRRGLAPPVERSIPGLEPNPPARPAGPRIRTEAPTKPFDATALPALPARTTPSGVWSRAARPEVSTRSSVPRAETEPGDREAALVPTPEARSGDRASPPAAGEATRGETGPDAARAAVPARDRSPGVTPEEDLAEVPRPRIVAEAAPPTAPTTDRPAGPGFEVARPLDEMPSSREILEEAKAADRPAEPRDPWKYPPLDLFHSPPEDLEGESDDELARKAELITTTLGHFGIKSTITRVTCGPTITQFELKPGAGVKLSKLTSLSDDLAMGLAVGGVRIEAPIPGRGAVGIEVPNKTSMPVYFQEMAAQKDFRRSRAQLTYVLGKGISGRPIVADLHKAPHMLVAGATGAGKSVCMNAIISSMLMRNSPEQLKMILIDPKMVEMMIYDGIAHLVTPVITDPKAAAAALQWAVMEMERRYKLLSKAGYRNISGFNKAVEAGEVTSEDVGGPPGDSRFGPLPYMVIVIDELADLMMVAAKDIEESICRLAQMARAVGMHLIVATQRPSTNVITGIIKANLPTRIAFRVASKIDSKVILDTSGAEALLGRGDMLYHPVGQPKPTRVQGAFIDEAEIKRLCAYIKEQCDPEYEDIVATVNEEKAGALAGMDEVHDEYLVPCIQFSVEKGEVSTSLLQRNFKIGYNRAACIIDLMEAKGVISGAESGRRRKVLVGPSEAAALIQAL